MLTVFPGENILFFLDGRQDIITDLLRDLRLFMADGQQDQVGILRVVDADQLTDSPPVHTGLGSDGIQIHDIQDVNAVGADQGIGPGDFVGIGIVTAGGVIGQFLVRHGNGKLRAGHLLMIGVDIIVDRGLQVITFIGDLVLDGLDLTAQLLDGSVVSVQIDLIVGIGLFHFRLAPVVAVNGKASQQDCKDQAAAKHGLPGLQAVTDQRFQTDLPDIISFVIFVSVKFIHAYSPSSFPSESKVQDLPSIFLVPVRISPLSPK